MKSDTTQRPKIHMRSAAEPATGLDVAVRFSTSTSTAAVGRAIARAARRLFGRRTPIIDRTGFGLVLMLVVMAIVGKFATPYGPFAVQPSDSLLPPSGTHPFGTDDVGRDVLSRLLAGAAVTLFSSVAIVIISTVIGVIIASAACLAPRWVDEAVMRCCDIFMSIPQLVLAIGVAAALGPSLTSIIVAMVVASWPVVARLMRGILRETMTNSYVEAAKILGVSRWRLMRRHALPNSLDAIYVQASMSIPGTIVMIAGLAFLGIGAPPPSPDWGSMIAEGQQYTTTAWWISLFPGLAITLAAVAFGLAGDAVRRMVDPSAKGT